MQQPVPHRNQGHARRDLIGDDEEGVERCLPFCVHTVLLYRIAAFLVVWVTALGTHYKRRGGVGALAHVCFAAPFHDSRSSWASGHPRDLALAVTAAHKNVKRGMICASDIGQQHTGKVTG